MISEKDARELAKELAKERYEASKHHIVTMFKLNELTEWYRRKKHLLPQWIEEAIAKILAGEDVNPDKCPKCGHFFHDARDCGWHDGTCEEAGKDPSLWCNCDYGPPLPTQRKPGERPHTCGREGAKGEK